MIVHAEINGNGVVTVKDQNLWGKNVVLSILDQEETESNQETDWEAIKEIFKKADTLDFPRRRYEEIIRDLHELRG